MRYDNLIVIGTSHIAKESIEVVEKTIMEENPDIVALELDMPRFQGLLSKKKDNALYFKNIFRIGIKGFIFSLIGAWVEKKLGESVGVTPGEDMLTAIRIAKKEKINIALIDQNIHITLKKISKNLSWKERWNFFSDIFKSIFGKKQLIAFDLSKVPNKNIIKKLMGKVRKRYPNIYRVLITERNEIMAANLSRIIEKYPEKKIIAIVGAGHEKDIIDLIKKEPLISYEFAVNN